MAVDPGVQAPTGDPGRISTAASRHDGLAGYFETTATAIEYTTGSLAGANWDGEAAGAYVNLASVIVDHFRRGGVVARSAAQTLRQYASQLEQFQREGVHAVDQTVHWMQQLQTDQGRLLAAQRAVSDAQTAVTKLA